MKKITDILQGRKMTAEEIINETEISKSSIYRYLKHLIDDGIVMKEDNHYQLIKLPPDAESIADDMSIIHQQKLMDKAYRKLPPSERADVVLQWYLDFQLKGKIEDYNYEKLFSAIDKGFTLFINKKKLDWEKHESSN